MAYNKTVWVNGEAPALNADNLNKIENALEAQDEDISELKSAIAKGSGLTTEIKVALLNIFKYVPFLSSEGETAYNELETALNPPTNLSYISAVYTQGSIIVYDTDSLDSLRSNLVVTAHYDDLTTETVTSYTLSGMLTEGTSTITATYGGKTATFNVTVTHSNLPIGFTEVDYLTSAVNDTPDHADLANTPYIKTGFPSVDTDTLNYKITLVFKPLYTDDAFIPFGGRNATTAGNTTRGLVLTCEPENESSLNYGNVTGTTKALVTYLGAGRFTAGTKYTLEITNGVIKLNDTTIGTFTANSAVQLADYPWALFGRNNGGRYTPTSQSGVGGGDLSAMIGNVYSFNIKNANNVDVLNFVPCYRNADGVYGMYDTVSNVFHTSAISTAFSGGNE